MDGTYGFVYCGDLGVGMGVFRIAGSELIGCDLAGGRYRGQISNNPDGSSRLSYQMTVPRGVFLVQGLIPMDVPYTLSNVTDLPPDFANGQPIEIDFAGSVTMMVRRIAGEYAPYADGMEVNVRPRAATG